MKRMAQQTLAAIGRALLESAPYMAAATPLGVWPVGWLVDYRRWQDSDAPCRKPTYHQGESPGLATRDPAWQAAIVRAHSHSAVRLEGGRLTR